MKTMWYTILFIAIFSCDTCRAFSWNDLWYTSNQQAAQQLQAGQADEAAKLFTDPTWQAVANYRAGNYAHAQQQFATMTTADAWYNKGNALAHLKQYSAAIAAYDQALKLDPHDKDAQFNRDLLNKLQQQQPQQQQPQPQQQQPQPQQQLPHPQQQLPQPQQQLPQPQQQLPQPQQQLPHPQQQQQQEKQQATQQWLNRIPDDPGGLLRQKFLRDYLKRQQQTNE